MKITSIKTISGPSVYHHRPVLIMTLDLGDLTEKASTDSPGFTDRLLGVLPMLREHRCSPGYVGGFVERLNRGTFAAHITEHVALALSELAGIGVGYGKAIYGGAPGIYKVVIRYKSEEGMKCVLEVATELVCAVWQGRPFDLEEGLGRIKRSVRRSELGPSTKAIVQAAQERNIPWRRLDDLSSVQLGYGKHRRIIQATTTSETSDIGVAIAQDKGLTKKYLEEAAIRVPAGRVVGDLEEALEAFRDLGAPVVLKPLDGNHGRGVFLNLTTEAEVAEAFKLSQVHSAEILVEESYSGKDYRGVVVGGKLVAASHRIPAHVIGDGVRSIRELAEVENRSPLRGEGHENVLTRITFDDETEIFLKKNGIALTDIPKKEQIVYLRETANLSTGGSADDVTDVVHPEIRVMCERAARIVGLDVCGIDLVIEDIGQSLSGQRGGIIEVNAGPGIRMHHYPRRGKPRDVAGAIVENLFRENQTGRIPIIAITGTNGKTTVTRIVSHILAGSGENVGTTTTDGIYLNGNLLSAGDTTGPVSARTILGDPSVDVAVLETARGGIVKRGLGFDWCDVGIITNIQADHIGQDGIESVEDILWIKSLVVERVRKGGTLVLNADSPELLRLVKEKPQLLEDDRKLVYFSLEEESEAIMEHAHRGGTCYFHRQGAIYELKENSARLLLRSTEIPITMGGTSTYQVANALAAIAASTAVGVPMDSVIEGLRSFSNKHNPGRTNLYQIGKGHLLLDYGHNPDAFMSVGEMVRKWGTKVVTGIIGTPGDRADRMISLAGMAAAHVFDKIIVREDDDLRGRKAGDVARLLLGAIATENKTIPTEVVLNAREALDLAVREMEEGEVLVYFYEDLEAITRALREHGAVPVDGIHADPEEREHHGRLDH